MTTEITGIGSISRFGPRRGLIPPEVLRVEAGPFRVEPFRAADVVPGLKTRRLDRLSVWSLVASALAMQDARLDLDREDRSRIAVVGGTGYGCVELTEAFFRSMAENGYAKADPILFPETLANSPAAHVARVFGIRGPNVTVGRKGQSGEAALQVARSLLRHGQADIAIVFAGDVCTRAIEEWFQAAGHSRGRVVPGEGLGSVVLEAGAGYKDRGARAYVPGSLARSAVTGEFDGSGILRLILGLS
jgi:3-oxoacyl-[acyl-carrier-protein] synthase II